LTLAKTTEQVNNQSSKEIQQLSKALLENGFTADVIEANYDLVKEALRLSKSGGLTEPLCNSVYSPIQGGFVAEQVYDRDGRAINKTIHDPVELFGKIKFEKEKASVKKENELRERKQRNDLDYYNYTCHIRNDSERTIYDVNKVPITRAYFDLPYRCPRPGCYRHFEKDDMVHRKHVRAEGYMTVTRMQQQ
jgi:hypothetical protein